MDERRCGHDMMMSMLFYSVHRVIFQHALSSYQYLKRTRKNCVTENHNASYRGLGQDGPVPSCPNPSGPSCLTSSLSKRGWFLEKVLNVAQFKPSSLLEWQSCVIMIYYVLYYH